MTIRRGYADGPHGQVHYRATPKVAGKAPLVALHATAYSSQSFIPLMQALAGVQQVIAIDAPGYGESDAPAAPIGMAGYADAIAPAIADLCDAPPVILGYHTGVYIAAELAITHSALALVLIGVPYFQALDFDGWRQKLATPHHLGDDLSQFAERWAYFVTNRHASVTLERGFRNFVDELKAWPDGARAHQAMFDYDSDARLPLVGQPVLVLNPEGHLAHPSRRAAALLPASTVEEMPDVSGPVLELAPDRIARSIAAWADALPR